MVPFPSSLGSDPFEELTPWPLFSILRPNIDRRVGLIRRKANLPYEDEPIHRGHPYPGTHPKRGHGSLCRSGLPRNGGGQHRGGIGNLEGRLLSLLPEQAGDLPHADGRARICSGAGRGGSEWIGALNEVITQWLLSNTGDLMSSLPALRTLLLRSIGAHLNEATGTR